MALLEKVRSAIAIVEVYWMGLLTVAMTQGHDMEHMQSMQCAYGLLKKEVHKCTSKIRPK